MVAPDFDDLDALPETDEPRSRVTPIKVVFAVLILASFAPWVYRYSGFADRPFDGTFDDAAFTEIGEGICTDADLDSLPDALEAVDNVDRSEQVLEANRRLTAMVDELEAGITGSDRDIDNLQEWIGDWRTYIGDRADYAERLATDPEAVLYIAAVDDERLERRITRFANTNKMWSCVTPSDVG